MRSENCVILAEVISRLIMLLTLFLFLSIYQRPSTTPTPLSRLRSPHHPIGASAPRPRTPGTLSSGTIAVKVTQQMWSEYTKKRTGAFRKNILLVLNCNIFLLIVDTMYCSTANVCHLWEKCKSGQLFCIYLEMGCLIRSHSIYKLGMCILCT